MVPGPPVLAFCAAFFPVVSGSRSYVQNLLQLSLVHDYAQATTVGLLTTFDLDDYVHTALRLGAAGFLLDERLPTDPRASGERDRSGPARPVTASSPARIGSRLRGVSVGVRR